MGKRIALLVGNSEYKDQRIEDISPLADDVSALKNVLSNPQIGGFDRIETLINSSSSEIRRELYKLCSSSKSDDTLLLYFAGHGFLDQADQFFLGVKDTEIGNLRETAVSDEYLSLILGQCEARDKFVFMDCSNSDNFLKKARALRGCSILNASSPYSKRRPAALAAGQHSAFTRYLIEGLETGRADGDLDGQIGVADLFNYVYGKLEVDRSQEEKPYFISFDSFSTVPSYIAKNPSLLMAGNLLDLSQQAKSASAISKLDAIERFAASELAQIVDNSKVFHTAIDTLTTLVNDSSKQVADKAMDLVDKLQDYKNRRQETSAKEKESPVTVSDKPKRVVNTGFAHTETPNVLIGSSSSLTTDESYFFWLEVGDMNPASIEETPTDLPEDIPVGAVLKVVLFQFSEGFQVDRKHSTGTLELADDGSVQVLKQPQIPTNLVAGSELIKRRLFFPVRTLSSEGIFNLRCNIYYEQILLQSRLIYARIMKSPLQIGQSLRSVLDYNLTKTLSPVHLNRLATHTLSLMVNSNGDGTHNFRFIGQDDFQEEAVIDGFTAQDLINQARYSLRNVSYGSINEWNGEDDLYANGFDFERLRVDLIRLAINGYLFYDKLINRFAGGADKAEELAVLMQKPGTIQIALRESAGLVVPAALFYDHPLSALPDFSENLRMFSLCPEFVKALRSGQPLEESKCFQGSCPNRGNTKIVCPSGFWGFRHSMGIPLSVATAPAIPPQISYDSRINFSVNVSTDKVFSLRKRHEDRLYKLRPITDWFYARSTKETIENLKNKKPHLVYFYCHGGVTRNIPYIQVGDPSEGGLTRAIFRSEKIFWRDPSPHPFVFINGCHTSALEPEVALDIVTALIENAQASGVMGTEITVFEPLATAFAEAFLENFFDGVNLGESVRKARLALLKDGNPLGLVYIPFAIASLHMTESTHS